jgi:hypothetical protein
MLLNRVLTSNRRDHLLEHNIPVAPKSMAITDPVQTDLHLHTLTAAHRFWQSQGGLGSKAMKWRPWTGGLSLRSDERPRKIGMKPSHPGDFIRTEVLDELHLSVARTAEIGSHPTFVSPAARWPARLSRQASAAADVPSKVP